jgi:hypothetical protein
VELERRRYAHGEGHRRLRGAGVRRCERATTWCTEPAKHGEIGVQMVEVRRSASDTGVRAMLRGAAASTMIPADGRARRERAAGAAAQLEPHGRPDRRAAVEHAHQVAPAGRKLVARDVSRRARHEALTYRQRACARHGERLVRRRHPAHRGHGDGNGCVLWQGRPAAGTPIVISVGVVASTAAATPATVTAVFATLPNPVPRTVAVVPGVSVAGVIAAIVGGTDPAGGATSTPSVPDTPSLTAVTVVAPGLAAMSRPDPSTLATSVTDELQVTARPTSTLPFRSVRPPPGAWCPPPPRVPVAA